jgi:hypothetical protein
MAGCPVGRFEALPPSDTETFPTKLTDDLSLSAYGLQDSCSIELLLKDLPWRDSDFEVQRKVMNGSVVCFKAMNYHKNAIRIDAQAAKAIALILAVRTMHLIICILMIVLQALNES